MTSSPISEPALAEVRSLIQQQQLIPAIKAYREATGCGLKDAKDAVEQLWERLHQEDPATYLPRPPASAMGQLWTLLAAIGVFAAIYLTISNYVLPRVAHGERVSPSAAVEFRALKDEPFEGSKSMTLPDGSTVHLGWEVVLAAADFESFQAVRAASSSPQVRLIPGITGLEKITRGIEQKSAVETLSLGFVVHGKLLARVSAEDYSNDGVLITFKGLSESDINEVFARLTE